MNNIIKHAQVKAMTPEYMEKVCRAEQEMLKQPQIEIETKHILHGGMYARTITMQPNTAVSGVIIKIPTMIIVNGHCTFSNNETPIELAGYNILTASAGRKQIVVAHDTTDITMIFPTKATTIEEAEMCFTDEYELLGSRKIDLSSVTITGERP